MDERLTVHRNGGGIEEIAAEAYGHYATPRADIFETGEAFVLMLELPGSRREAISLNMHGGTLVVKADVRRTVTENGVEVLREIRTPGYYRSFRIGQGIDLGTVDATFDLGVLTVKLLKSPEMKPREIPIH